MRLLTDEQLEALRAVPPNTSNRVKVAMAITGASQSELVDDTGFTQPYVSDVVRCRFRSITVDNARKFAEFFGCGIEDLFPAREQGHVGDQMLLDLSQAVGQ